MDQSYYADVRNEVKFVVILIGKNSKKKKICWFVIWYIFCFHFLLLPCSANMLYWKPNFL